MGKPGRALVSPFGEVQILIVSGYLLKTVTYPMSYAVIRHTWEGWRTFSTLSSGVLEVEHIVWTH